MRDVFLSAEARRHEMAMSSWASGVTGSRDLRDALRRAAHPPRPRTVISPLRFMWSHADSRERKRVERDLSRRISAASPVELDGCRDMIAAVRWCRLVAPPRPAAVPKEVRPEKRDDAMNQNDRAERFAEDLKRLVDEAMGEVPDDEIVELLEGRIGTVRAVSESPDPG